MSVASSVEFRELVSLVPNALYYSVSGAHLYGWESPDSDIDIRGCHVIPLNKMIGLHKPRDVIEKTIGLYDFVSFDLEKELGLVMANNCNVLENISAMPITLPNKFSVKLEIIARHSLSKIIAKPYFGLAKSNYLKWIAGKDFVSTKKYLYVIRALMSGVYALRKEKIVADINVLNRDSLFGYSLVDELVAKKKQFKEKEEQKMNFDAESLIKKLYLDLEQAEKDSNLPDKPENFEEANQFLIDTRLNFV